MPISRTLTSKTRKTRSPGERPWYAAVLHRQTDVLMAEHRAFRAQLRRRRREAKLRRVQAVMQRAQAERAGFESVGCERVTMRKMVVSEEDERLFVWADAVVARGKARRALEDADAIAHGKTSRALEQVEAIVRAGPGGSGLGGKECSAIDVVEVPPRGGCEVKFPLDLRLSGELWGLERGASFPLRPRVDGLPRTRPEGVGRNGLTSSADGLREDEGRREALVETAQAAYRPYCRDAGREASLAPSSG